MKRTGQEEVREEELAGIPSEIQQNLEKDVSEWDKEMTVSASQVSDAKDRAQVTAAGALSLSLIVLVKELVDRGPGFEYYYISLGMASLAICLQVTIGLLGIIMYSMKMSSQLRDFSVTHLTLKTKGQGKMYSENLCNDLSKDPGKSGTETCNSTTKGPLCETQDLLRGFKMLDGQLRPVHMKRGPFANNNDKTTLHDCSLDEANRRLFTILSVRRLRADLEYSEAKVKSIRCDESIQAEAQKAVEDKLKALNVITTQQRVIGHKLLLSEKRQLSRRINRVQQAITYMYYIVFVLNAFLTGFGLTGTTTDTDTVDPDANLIPTDDPC